VENRVQVGGRKRIGKKDWQEVDEAELPAHWKVYVELMCEEEEADIEGALSSSACRGDSCLSQMLSFWLSGTSPL
jgi:hypothetical protein